VQVGCGCVAEPEDDGGRCRTKAHECHVHGRVGRNDSEPLVECEAGEADSAAGDRHAENDQTDGAERSTLQWLTVLHGQIEAEEDSARNGVYPSIGVRIARELRATQSQAVPVIAV
jgi:hypothetical protein